MAKESAKRIENSMRTLEAIEIIRLSARDSQAFVLALSEPTPVNERLLETIRRYREATGR
jgi:uncharacterized protein (DUF1778 family)